MKIIAFDLDDVLCFREKKYESAGVDKYKYCQPLMENIEIMNQCYDYGFFVKIYTARGMTQFKGDYQKIIDELYPLTETQLKSWGAKYHQLIFGKTHYELLIDDKACHINEIKSLNDIVNKTNGI